MVGVLRHALDPRAATLGDIPDYDLRLGHRLFEALLKPVESAWRDAKNLIVVAHGPLGYLPLLVLPTEAVDPPDDSDLLFSGYRSVPWLARTHAVTVLPSTGALKTLWRTATRSRERDPFVGFGDPVFNPSAGDRDETVTAALANRGVLDLRGMPIELRSLPATGAFRQRRLVDIASPARYRRRGEGHCGRAARRSRPRRVHRPGRQRNPRQDHGPQRIQGGGLRHPRPCPRRSRRAEPAGPGAERAGDTERAGRRLVDHGRDPRAGPRRRLDRAFGLQHERRRRRRRRGHFGPGPGLLLRGQPRPISVQLAGRDDQRAKTDDRSVSASGGRPRRSSGRRRFVKRRWRWSMDRDSSTRSAASPCSATPTRSSGRRSA